MATVENLGILDWRSMRRKGANNWILRSYNKKRLKKGLICLKLGLYLLEPAYMTNLLLETGGLSQKGFWMMRKVFLAEDKVHVGMYSQKYRSKLHNTLFHPFLELLFTKLNAKEIYYSLAINDQRYVEIDVIIPEIQIDHPCALINNLVRWLNHELATPPQPRRRR